MLAQLQSGGAIASTLCWGVGRFTWNIGIQIQPVPVDTSLREGREHALTSDRSAAATNDLTYLHILVSK